MPVLPAQPTGTVEDLAAAWTAIQAGVAARGLHLFAMIPDQQVAFAPADLSWEAFVDLGAELGSRIIYSETSRFSQTDAAQFPPPADPQADDGQTAQQRYQDAQAQIGQLAEVELAFAHQGILHVWSVQAAWRARLDAAVAHTAEQRRPSWTPGDLGGRRFMATDHADQGDTQEQAELTRAWVAELLDDPAFRAGTHSKRRIDAALLKLPALRDAHRDYYHPNYGAARDALRIALEEAGIRQLQFEQELTGRLQELAAELAATDDWATATTKSRREHLARQLLAARSDGWAPSYELVEQLIFAAEKLKPSRRRTSTT